ncbi:MAG TPA: hypothetical protein EYP98_18200 [Planctomycetes bacterium]|nr:hypothetical protein [Planctomycetota bacterium]
MASKRQSIMRSETKTTTHDPTLDLQVGSEFRCSDIALAIDADEAVAKKTCASGSGCHSIIASMSKNWQALLWLPESSM